MLLAALYVGRRFCRRGLLRLCDVFPTGPDRRRCILSPAWQSCFTARCTSAVGSACSELKDAQSLMMPVMLLSMFPIFVWTAVLKNPASPLVGGHVAVSSGLARS